jgi:hypothetical protein
LLSEVSIDHYAISPDDKDVVFTRADRDNSGIWIAPLDARSEARQLVNSQAFEPLFSRTGEILFVRRGKDANYLYGIKPDGKNLHKLISSPIDLLINVSPDGRWIIASRESGGAPPQQTLLAYSLDGARPRILCRGCAALGTIDIAGPPVVSWSGDGKTIFASSAGDGADSEGRTVIMPVKPGEPFPLFFGSDSMLALHGSEVPGSQVLEHTIVFPGPHADTYAVWKVNTQRNLYRIGLP